MAEILATHALPLLALLVGHATQVLMALVTQRKAGRDIGLAAYIRSRPYSSAIAVLGSIGGYLMLVDTSQLSVVAAWGMGYAADNMVKTLADRSERVAS